MTPAPKDNTAPDECRDAFEAHFKKNALDFELTKDAWDRPIYKHSHIQAMFDGWQAAWSMRVPDGWVAVPVEILQEVSQLIHRYEIWDGGHEAYCARQLIAPFVKGGK